MVFIDRDTLSHGMNRLGTDREPFLWGISYNLRKGFLIPRPLEQDDVLWQIGRHGNCHHIPKPRSHPSLTVTGPTPPDRYARMFARVREGLMRGDSFLANLTATTAVECSGSLRDVFLCSDAPFRLLIDDSFVCFSPEPFVTISGRRIATFPMKGTADASIPGADRALMESYKETCEHHTIVDLMRNDLNSVAEEVTVERFRYMQTIQTSAGPILQTSSEISGILPEEKALRFGDVILPMLPAGSITGAPKSATVRLIDEAEEADRGWYTGVFGYFDGSMMQTAVMIRCIQRGADGQLFFHSGGGITVNSSEKEEYHEMLAKVYLSR